MNDHSRSDALADVPLRSKTCAPWLRAALCSVLIACPLLAGPVLSDDTRAAAAPLLEQLPQRWSDDQGRDIRLGDFRGRRVFFTMAFTSCRRICPMTMARLQELQRELDAGGQSAEFVIVGYDPAVDDPRAWRQYRRSRGLLRDNWHFLTGSVASTEQFARRLGFPFWKYDAHVMHDYRVVVVDERGELAAEYNPRTARLPADPAGRAGSEAEHVRSGEN
jgi:cytochrome oxidase Cu insertion factor (SCO1/SenC/PrrC family)